jgi:hypothetical protein
VALRGQYETARQNAKQPDATPEDIALWNAYERAANRNAALSGQGLGAFRLNTEAQALESGDYKTVAMDRLQEIYGEGKVPESAVKRVSQHDDGDYAALYGELRKMATEQGGWLHPFLYGNMLSSPMTQVLNTVSNVGSIATHALDKLIAAPLDAAAGAVTGKRTARIGEGMAFMRGMDESAAPSTANIPRDFKRGFGETQAKNFSEFGGDAPRGELPGGMATRGIGECVRLPPLTKQ